MEKQLLPKMAEKERIETLENSADRVEEFSYTKPFTPEQIVVFKDELSTTMISLKQIEDEFESIKDEFKARMKPLKEDIKIHLINIMNKAEFVHERCFVMFENDEAGYYNQAGELVYRRPLLPGEKQKSIFSITKDGTND
jgi:hypothetical protein